MDQARTYSIDTTNNTSSRASSVAESSVAAPEISQIRNNLNQEQLLVAINESADSNMDDESVDMQQDSQEI